jgi:DNA-binding GntR family transcriptional regulator
MAFTHDSFAAFLRQNHELDSLLDDCAGNPFTAAALGPLRSHCRRFWYVHRKQVQLSDTITAHAQMARLVARRDFNGAQKASDANLAALERLINLTDRMT